MVFIDETGIHLAMARNYGRAKIGDRIHEAKRQRPRVSEKYTWISAISTEGVFAPFELNGSMTGMAFIVYLREVLLPQLKPYHIVVMDNLASHKVRGVEEAFIDFNIGLKYLPPYSPDLSPIEEFWSKFKAYLRKVAKRNVKDLREAAITAFDLVTQSDIKGWFGHFQETMQSIH